MRYDIVVRFEEGIWVAFFQNDPDARGTGSSANEAVGDLVRGNPSTFNINFIEG
jgi:hypothetical protein